VAFILNDRPDLAAALGADGVHIGQEDSDYANARAAIGSAGIVGVTCHDSKHLAYEAAEQGADYVAFGAFFPTATKEPKTRADVELLRDWSLSMTVPCVAIGGITVENCAPLVETGADFLAVVNGVWSFPAGPAAAVAAFNEIFARTPRAS
jgi:thiamine-phosphate pyrophosphorylase